jgi:hypothetical protein
MQPNIDMLGWFWGKIRTMVKAEPLTTIAEVLGEGKFWEYKRRMPSAILNGEGT